LIPTNIPPSINPTIGKKGVDSPISSGATFFGAGSGSLVRNVIASIIFFTAIDKIIVGAKHLFIKT
jgi:hypothetical protein